MITGWILQANLHDKATIIYVIFMRKYDRPLQCFVCKIYIFREKMRMIQKQIVIYTHHSFLPKFPIVFDINQILRMIVPKD